MNFLLAFQRSNEVKITERAVRLELSLQHRPDAILNLGDLFHALKNKNKRQMNAIFFEKYHATIRRTVI